MVSLILAVVIGWGCGKLDIPGRWLPKNPITRAANKLKADVDAALVHDLTQRMRPAAPPPQAPPPPPAG